MLHGIEVTGLWFDAITSGGGCHEGAEGVEGPWLSLPHTERAEMVMLFFVILQMRVPSLDKSFQKDLWVIYGVWIQKLGIGIHGNK